MNKYDRWRSNFIELENNKENLKEIETLCHISIDMLNEETQLIRIYKDNLGGYIEKLKNNNLDGWISFDGGMFRRIQCGQKRP